jgi:hypothetical protein
MTPVAGQILTLVGADTAALGAEGATVAVYRRLFGGTAR